MIRGKEDECTVSNVGVQDTVENVKIHGGPRQSSEDLAAITTPLQLELVTINGRDRDG